MRSERSLIQTIGRAARNLQGRAILYADNVTGSMQRAIDETTRRRDTQTEFNELHGITPIGIKKAVSDVMEAGGSSRGKGKGRRGAKSVKTEAQYENLSVADAAKRMKELEKQMYDSARNLEFERAAELRDELEQLRVNVFQGGEGVITPISPSKKRVAS